MKSILDKVKSQDTGSYYDDIVEACLTYQDYGQLLVELLEYFSGYGNYDDRTAEFLAEMYSEYYDQTSTNIYTL